ncbi:MAG: hypothetical protein O9340_13155 [Cyclobacteriaceae bacterium]|jgi:hypothetical protein|nr:hypothetical protein [Cyclobacteriaceae bacterium]
MLKTKQFLLIISLFLFFISPTNAQEFTKHSIKMGFGFGASMFDEGEGMGVLHSIGYQQQLRNERARINYNLIYGRYKSGSISDVPDQFFNSISFQTLLYFDLIRIQSFSVIMGAGGFLNYATGLTGTGGDPGRRSSDYFQAFHIGACTSLGFRVSNTKKRMGFTVLPMALSRGTKDFLELTPKFELEFKF